ncbi:MAG: hypothetical protein LC799_26095 [Actinobacteria bacterium]|nr:hypothetical protein [Actinomycetota bacterium]
MSASSLIEQVRAQWGGSVRSEGTLAVTEACSLRQVLQARITDPAMSAGDPVPAGVVAVGADRGGGLWV